jgi:hypothetical protein
MAKKLEELLGRLPERSDEDVAAVTLVGRALSRSDTHLHLATSKGVVAVPLAQIDDVRVRFADDPARVSVKVRDPDSVRLMRRALVPRARPDIDPGPVTLRARPDIDPGPVIIRDGVGTTVCNTTYTGEGEDQVCDDEDCSSASDDQIGF